MSALLAGTFAWSAISQMALNEAVENDMAPGGRLHDDFNGKNLDIYVENYGTNSIYAKVKILEYMEIGDGAGKKGAYDPNEIQDDGISKGVWGIDSDNNATSIKTGAKIGDTSTWTVHAPVAGVDDCGTAGGGAFHLYWQWVTGGQKVYMPTFNKDPESLESDITGLDTTAGVTPDTYSNKVSDPTAGGIPTTTLTKPSSGGTINLDGSHNQLAMGDEAEDYATYNQIDPPVVETHTAKETLSGTVLTMTEWTSAGSKPGPYWVMGDDGWAYWAEAIQPDAATGLLLDNIALAGQLDQEWYYALEPVASFATLSDIGKLRESSDAGGQKLLDELTKPTVTSLTVYPGTSVAVDPGGEVNFSTLVYGDNFPSQEVRYELSEPVGSPTGAPVAQDPETKIDATSGKLTVGRNELNTGFTVTVTSVVDPTMAQTITVDVNVLSMEFVYDTRIAVSDAVFGDADTVNLLIKNGDNNYIVDWGDGTVPTVNADTHDYVTTDNYTITVSGRTLGGIAFNANDINGAYNSGELRLTAINTPLLQQASLSFNNYFRHCMNLAEIPSDLFINNPNAQSFRHAFDLCSALTMIPDDLFASNTKVTVFEGTFAGCMGIEEIPSGLFDNNTEVTNFWAVFQSCTSIEEIPIGLFTNNTKATDFRSVFNGCTSLTAIPSDLFSNNKAATDFNYAFGDCTGIKTALPDWWDTGKYPQGTYPQFYLTGTAVRMFIGCTEASNWADVPAEWK
ncbi:MAG: leucine-rich repeat domain-containing protein [Coriobacteriales bacterium]|jgi:hypothetical protein|nr:leucine-rich repeat domain-containing protein [Coriobacteriales bacterium]